VYLEAAVLVVTQALVVLAEKQAEPLVELMAQVALEQAVSGLFTVARMVAGVLVFWVKGLLALVMGLGGVVAKMLQQAVQVGSMAVVHQQMRRNLQAQFALFGQEQLVVSHLLTQGTYNESLY
jgi:hypothetical protein